MDQTDILLIPPVINPVDTDQASNFIPVGLLALLGNLDRHNISAEIYKPEILITSDDDFEKVAQDILSRQPGSIGFSTWCDSYPHSLLIAEAIKKLNPDMPIIFGGPQASILAAETMHKFPFIDYILQGEADRTLPELVSCVLNGGRGQASHIKGLTCRDPETGKTISNEQVDVIVDLDQLPVPAYEKILLKNKLRIDAGRGCPYQCTYCSTSQFFSRKYRVKSAKRLIGEIEYCNRRMGVSNLGISHDMFTFDNKLVNEFSSGIRSLNDRGEISYTWTCSSRTDAVSKEMLTTMGESGCKAIFFGIESGSARIQKKIRKNLDPGRAAGIASHSAALGIHTAVSYMAGFPEETREDLNDTLTSVLTVALSGARPQLTILSVLPGTTMYQEHCKDLEYDGRHSGFSTTFLTERSRKMVEDDKELFSSFYHLPNSMILRETYLFLADLVNNMEHFIPTILLLSRHIEDDMKSLRLLDFIEQKMPDYQRSQEIFLPELFFLTDSLKQYIEYLQSRGLPDYIWDVFLVDFTKAFMIAGFEGWQQIEAGKKKSAPASRNLSDQDKIRVFPYWKVIETDFYLYEYLMNPVGKSGNFKFRRGRYHYLILPVTHRQARIFKIPDSLVPVYKTLKDSTVRGFIKKNMIILGEEKARRTLRKMIRTGLVEIEPKR